MITDGLWVGTRSWVYLHIIGDAVAYVGCTCNYTSRQSQHRRTSPWYGQITDVVKLGPFTDRQEALDLERELIEQLQPPHNLQYTELGRRRMRAHIEHRQAVCDAAQERATSRGGNR